MIEPERNFQSITEEKDYYKQLAVTFEKEYRETKVELEEFQVSSREFETELELQLEQTESKNKELRNLTTRLQIENKNLKDKLQDIQHGSRKQILDLEEEVTRVKHQRDDLQRYIRELEQANDDLERAKRATVSSLEDFESRLNQAIERNAFLESELDEKEMLKITVQRLKDESRDLRQEMVVNYATKPVYDGSYPLLNGNHAEKVTSIDSNKLEAELDSNIYSFRDVNVMGAPIAPLTPSTRISALNIVGDLLRKVGALESKLASCRAYVKDLSPKSEKDESEITLASPTKTKRLSKDSSLSSPQENLTIVA